MGPGTKTDTKKATCLLKKLEVADDNSRLEYFYCSCNQGSVIPSRAEAEVSLAGQKGHMSSEYPRLV